MTITIDDVRLPEHIEKGATGGPAFRTTVLIGDSGRVVTNQNWEFSRGIWRVAYGMMRKVDFTTVIAFFRARRGMSHGFLFKDWTDFEITRQLIGTADGAETDFPVFKIYDDSVSDATRRIFRPVEDTITIWVNNVEASPTGWSLEDTGIIQFTSAPATGDIEIQCEFDVPVMFGSDQLTLQIVHADAASVQEIEILELRE